MSEYIYATDEHKGHWLTGEEIVRCRDCTHFITWANGYSFCSAFSIGATGDPFPGEPDGFCAWACRKSDKE